MPSRTVTAVLEANTSGYIAGINRAAAVTKQFADRSSAAISKNRESLSTLTTGAGLLAAGVAVGVGAAVKSFSDFDSAMSGVASTGADARQSLGDLRAVAIKAGADTKYSATEAAAGIEALAKAGVSSKDAIGGGLTGALNLAAAGNLDVAGSAEVAASAMTQFGLAGKDVPKIADLLAAGAGKAQGEVSDMAAALNQAGLIASQTGLSLEETTGGLAAFASAGLIGSDAGTSFKTMLQSLTPTSVEAKSLMAELGISAYDAQGSFIGLEGFAQNLRDSLKDLSDEQRNAALKTIFGSDATRAASVIYEQGGAGIRKWTDAVDDQGYAAEVARIKMDNLRGDLELLSGSFDTALINLGAGADGPLRGLVQGATEAVNALGGIDGSTQSAILGIGGTVAVTGLAAAGFGKLVVSVSDSREALEQLAPTGGRARGVVTGLGKAAGVAAGALIGLQVAGVIGRAFGEEFTPSVDNAAGALLRLASAGNVAQLDQGFTFSSGALIKDQISGVDDALSRLAENRWTDRFGESVDRWTGDTDAATSMIKKQFEATDAAISNLDPTEASDAFNMLAQQAEEAGLPVEKLIELFPRYSATMRQAAEAAGIKVTSDEQLAVIMSGKVPEALKESEDGLKDVDSATRGASGGVKAMGLSAEDAKKQLDDLVDSLFDAGDAANALSDAEISYERAVAAASKAAKDNKKSTDLSTKAGQDQREALNRQSDASKRFIEQLVSQGASTKDVREATRDAREAFLKNAEEMGHSAEEAKNLADQQGLIERDIKIVVEAPKAPKVISDFEKLKARIENLPEKKQIDIIFGSNAKDLAEAYKLKLTGNSGERDSVDSSRRAGAAAGGILAGRTPYYRGDDIAYPMARGGVQPLRGGEGIYVTEAMDDPYERSRLLAVNKAALRGESLTKFRGEHEGLAGGGFTSRINLGVSGFPSPSTADIFGTVGDRLAVQIGNRLGDALGKRLDGLVGAGGGVGPIDVSNPRGLTSFRGGTFTNLGAANLRKAEEIAGVVMRVIQGGFRPTTTYSGTSHAGDAADSQNDARLIRALRKVGWASGDRTGLGLWAPHAHSVATKGSGFPGGSGVYQASDYLRRGGASQPLGSPWGLATGGVVRGGRGGGLFEIGEGKYDELVLPLPKGLSDLVGRQEIFALIRALSSPLGDIAAAVREVTRSNAGVRAAGRDVSAADSRLDAAKAARRRQGRLVNSLDERAREATENRDRLEERREALSEQRKKLQDRRDDLRDRRDDAKGKRRRELSAQLARADRAFGQADDRVERVERQARAARLEEIRVNRALKRERADLERADATIEQREKSKAAAINRSREAQEKAKSAADALAQAQRALADEAQRVSDSFTAQYRSTSTDVQDWLETMRTGTTDLEAFTRQIAKLRASGLSETLIQQIIGLGAEAGGDIAQQIGSGGSNLIRDLNGANKGLQDAADTLGYLAGSRPEEKVFRAFGPVAAGREVIDRNYARTGGFSSAVVGSIDMAAVQAGLAGMQVLVENPWTGEYHEARMRAVAGSATARMTREAVTAH